MLGAGRTPQRLASGVAAAMLTAACSVGAGTGEVSLAIFAPECKMQGETRTLHPNFFAATPVRDMTQIRIQRGSGIELESDGLFISVQDVNDIRQNRLGEELDVAQPLDVTGGARPPASITFYYNESCKVDRDENPVVYLSRGGALIFRRMYAPDIDKQDREIAGSLVDVLVVDPSAPETRKATLNGDFRFLFVRGRPAQPFPGL